MWHSRARSLRAHACSGAASMACTAGSRRRRLTGRRLCRVMARRPIPRKMHTLFEEITMYTPSDRVIIPGSERPVHPQAKLVGPTSADERFDVTLRLRPRAPLPALSLLAKGGGAPLSREQYAASYGADPADVAKVAAFAASYGLVLVDTSLARCSMLVSGTASQFAAAFGAHIEQSEHEHGMFRSRSGALTVPADLNGIVLGVFGIDNAPLAEPRYQIGAVVDEQTVNAADASYTAPQVAAASAAPTSRSIFSSSSCPCRR